jgi:antitoxin ParD1/3/4
MAMSADLGSTLENYVSKLVEEGRYNSKSEVLREGVRLVQEREAKLAALNAAIEEGMVDIRQGNSVSSDEVFDRLEAKYREMATKLTT